MLSKNKNHKPKPVEHRGESSCHKSFNAMESKALHETLKKERQLREHFEMNKHLLLKPRNPLNGELTCREGMYLMGDMGLQTNPTEGTRRRKSIPVAGKIGSLYFDNDIVHNSETESTENISLLTSLRKRKETVLERLKQAENVAKYRQDLLQQSLASNRMKVANSKSLLNS